MTAIERAHLYAVGGVSPYQHARLRKKAVGVR